MQAPSILSFSQHLIQRETLNTARIKGKQSGDGCEMHTPKDTLLLESSEKSHLRWRDYYGPAHRCSKPVITRHVSAQFELHFCQVSQGKGGALTKTHSLN